MWGNINAVKYYKILKNMLMKYYIVLNMWQDLGCSSMYFYCFLVNKSSRKPPKSRQRKVWLSLNVLQ